MTRFRGLPIPLFLLLAAVSGAVAGYSALRLLQERSRPLGFHRTVTSVIPESNGIRLLIDGYEEVYVDTTRSAGSARILQLIYPGKTVHLEDPPLWAGTRTEEGACRRLTLGAQPRPPAIDTPRYRELIGMGFSDTELGYAHALPAGVANPNPGPPPYGADSTLSPPTICATERDHGS